MPLFVPRETKFQELFTQLGDLLTAGAALLHQTLSSMADVEVKVQKLKELENQADEATHTIFTQLNKTFITPFDREDIHSLASSLDDVLDLTYAAGERVVMYDIATVAPAAIEVTGILVRQCEQIAKALHALDRHDEVLRYCVEINRLENEVDRITRRAIATLFAREKDPIALIKSKELHEVLEDASDAAEDVANVLETMMVKSA